MITELAIKNGIKLDFKQEQLLSITENDVYMIYDNNKKAIICVDELINENLVNDLQKYKDYKFICLDRALNTSTKWNLQQLFAGNLSII